MLSVCPNCNVPFSSWISQLLYTGVSVKCVCLYFRQFTLVGEIFKQELSLCLHSILTVELVGSSMANYNTKTLQDTFCTLIQLLLYTVRYSDGVVWWCRVDNTIYQVQVFHVALATCFLVLVYRISVGSVNYCVCLYNYVSVCVILPAIYLYTGDLQT